MDTLMAGSDRSNASLSCAGVNRKGLWIAITGSEFSSLLNQLSDLTQVIILPQPSVSLPEKWAHWCNSVGQLEDANDLVETQQPLSVLLSLPGSPSSTWHPHFHCRGATADFGPCSKTNSRGNSTGVQGEA